LARVAKEFTSKVTNEKTFEPVKAGLAVMFAANKLFPGFQINKNNFIDKLAGTSMLRRNA
jgi:hypothetical protein